MVNIKGHEFSKLTIRDSYNRRALQYKNNIINCLRSLGISEDDIEIELEPVAMRKGQASVAWYVWNEHLFLSYNGSSKFVDNIAMVAQIIKYFINLLEKNEITQEEFLEIFMEEPDILEQRKNARSVLCVEEDSLDFEKIHENYKKLSKKFHPDMPEGNTERFKRINKAHKILKKELR
ncbi:J domain-containing protein [Candidatus Woesearchaeota archaeon]|jgi:hypothetical protein|nr:J domain-containing protein [Candidatus Woesearchaeota archaeon]MBT6519308.1 J domain-containing protein [Candidatus Woesearchaeota archaeon]MBT7368961.1 J domain-containing protein [Candidatus Woesearchaeota archaeon]